MCYANTTMSTPYPKKSKDFAQWAKLMQEQATVPDRVQYKKKTAVKGGRKSRNMRKKRIRRIRRTSKD